MSVLTKDPFNCLVVGVGGQGVVLASRLIAAACMHDGAFVRTAETIGMSQRGGTVATHVRVAEHSDQIPSSLISRGSADLILAFEPTEALRAYGSLKTGGALVCATQAVVPSSCAASGYEIAPRLDWLRTRMPPECLALIDADTLSSEGINPKCLNVMLLGAAIALEALPFSRASLENAIFELVKPHLVEMNMRALELGMKFASHSTHLG